ncbi:MAG: OPT family oligopeptide transporter [Elusimicrobia bacterium]|nr:OPT family oligopeptide transporter [Elusimicrobiota bacterium]
MTPETQNEDAGKTPEQIELEWYKNVYRGDTMPQLTLRAVLMGAVLGGFMSLTNLYIGLKTGWALGVAITSCILSFAIYKTLMAIFPGMFRTEMSILENNCMQSTASSAGYSTGGTMVGGVAAYMLVTGHHMDVLTLTLWTIFLAALGVFMAIPMKRQMINVEKLKFPSGIAAAETLKSLHSKGAEAVHKAWILAGGGVFGGLLAWLRDARLPSSLALPAQLSFPGTLAGYPLAKWTISFDMSAIMVAAGAIMGWRIAWSMLVGGLINYAFLAPYIMQTTDAIDPAALGFREIVKWSTWGGAGMMVTAGLLMFFMQWKTIVRAFSGLGSLFSKQERTAQQDELAKIEVPGSWFVGGAVISGLGCMAVMHFSFGTVWLVGLLAVVLAFFLSIVACRTTGESDITPMGAMGRIAQLTFGVVAPANIVTNLMTASVTAGAASSAADLLTDLKSGYLLGANPRRQFLAQFFGIFAGTLVVVPAFYILVPDASVLGGDKWPAPAALVWAAVANLLSSGFASLHHSAKIALLIGGVLGVVMTVLELVSPKMRRYMPSPIGLGLAMVIPFWNSLSMFLGALAALILEKRNPALADKTVIPFASGVIAGESILGILIALLVSAGLIAG